MRRPPGSSIISRSRSRCTVSTWRQSCGCGANIHAIVCAGRGMGCRQCSHVRQYFHLCVQACGQRICCDMQLHHNQPQFCCMHTSAHACANAHVELLSASASQVSLELSQSHDIALGHFSIKLVAREVVGAGCIHGWVGRATPSLIRGQLLHADAGVILQQLIQCWAMPVLLQQQQSWFLKVVGVEICAYARQSNHPIMH